MAATNGTVLGIALGVALGWISMYVWMQSTMPPCSLRDCPVVECPRAVTPASNSRVHQLVEARALARRDSKLFPLSQLPSECVNPGILLHVALRQGWITADPQPIKFGIHVHPAHEDVHVSASIFPNEGNIMFEMHIKSRIYQTLRAVDGSYPRPKDPLFLDVGANIGIHSLFTAALKIRTHAFEPMPKNLNLLQCSVSANPFLQDYYFLNGFALSDKTSDGGCMNVERGNQGNSFFEMSNANCVSTGIKLRRLDDYWDQVLDREQIFLMKMDVQGFEGFVVKGAPEMFKSKPPLFIFMEYTPSRYRTYGIDAAQILRDLINYGYTIRVFNGQEITLHNGVLERLAASPDGFECDLELVHTDTLNKYKGGTLSF